MNSRAILAAALAAGTCGTAFGQGLSERINYLMQQRSATQSRSATKGQLLGTLLYNDLTVQFQDTSARDAFRYLNTVLGINIVVRYSDDRIGYGIDPDILLNLDVSDRPAINVLELILDQCTGAGFGDECTWQLRDGFVEVGTKERLNLSREIRYYPIRDLVFEVPNFDNAPALDLDAAINQGNTGGGGGGGSGGGGGGFGGGGGGGGGGSGGGGLFGDPGAPTDRIGEEELADDIMQIIRESVEPDNWLINGGDAASVRYFQGTLIVRAPDYVHRELDGYPFPIRPPARVSATGQTQRYLSFKDGKANVQDGGAPPVRGVTAKKK